MWAQLLKVCSNFMELFGLFKHLNLQMFISSFQEKIQLIQACTHNMLYLKPFKWHKQHWIWTKFQPSSLFLWKIWETCYKYQVINWESMLGVLGMVPFDFHNFFFFVFMKVHFPCPKLCLVFVFYQVIHLPQVLSPILGYDNFC